MSKAKTIRIEENDLATHEEAVEIVSEVFKNLLRVTPTQYIKIGKDLIEIGLTASNNINLPMNKNDKALSMAEVVVELAINHPESAHILINEIIKSGGMRVGANLIHGYNIAEMSEV